MSNYQPDINEYFGNGVDYIMYDGEDYLIDKCRYFLTHKDERTEIAANEFNKIKAHHTYTMRLQEIYLIKFSINTVLFFFQFIYAFYI